MKEKRLINILGNNREFFEQDEEIKLKVEIKNIQVLTIKIFEMNLENFYLKNINLNDIDLNINLEGLIPNEEKIFNFNELPMVKSIKEFSFDTITEQNRGTFVVEFVGNGITSRAIIRKGNLIILEKMTLSGQLFTILNEKLEICKKEVCYFP